MKITCKHCGIVEKPHRCPKISKEKRNRIDSKAYSKRGYKTVRSLVLGNHNFLDLYSLFVESKYITANITHHIIEVLEDESKAEDYDNLIPVSKESHDKIHELYKIDKNSMQKLLVNMLKDYANGEKTLGKYKEEIKKICEKNWVPPYI